MRLQRWFVPVFVLVALSQFQCAGRPDAGGTATTVPRPPLTRAQAEVSWTGAKQVFEQRCAVCHACYDAPCQLKLDSGAGITRGASKQKVYEAPRVLPVPPTRLGIDAKDAHDWRLKGFHPVLPEGAKTDPRASLLVRMLELKRQHPLPEAMDLAQSFTFDLDRAQTCSDADHFDEYARAHPLWGMPYGLPGLDEAEHERLVAWVEDGAPTFEPPPAATAITAAIERWEAFLNEPSLKSQLMARYVYEHLFLATLYFKGIDDTTLFRLVRSRTPPGTDVDEIATRRPFDDPQALHLYYRLVRRDGPVMAKTNMAYALDDARISLYRELFLVPEYVVDALPSYAPEIAANPFRAFAAIPMRSRYRFMLTEAAFTIMGFIKGPVCRGQVALNVIQDRFWVTFLDPDAAWSREQEAFLPGVIEELDLPAEAGSASVSVLWRGYEKAHDRYMARRKAFLTERLAAGRGVALTDLWDGDGDNTNAALTIFRHFDTATVLQGFIGAPTETAWVIDYPLLERIHSLLVAGFDVWGNTVHQLATRVYMDFLRMEGESNWLLLLPPERRAGLVARWYRDMPGWSKERVQADLQGFTGAPSVAFKTAEPETELFDLVRARLGPVVSRRHELPAGEGLLKRLDGLHGAASSWMPEVSMLTVRDGETRKVFSLLRESAHKNVAELFNEEQRRLPAEDVLQVLPGVVGSYPNALFEVDAASLESFVEAVGRLDGKESYRAFRLRFGVLRNSARFWPHLDALNRISRALGPVEAGILDLNHLESL